MKYDLSEEIKKGYKEELYSKVRAFKQRYTNLYYIPSGAALHNYAISLLNIDYYKLGQEDREEVLKQYTY